MAEDVVLGIDAGSSGVRALALSRSGEVIGSATSDLAANLLTSTDPARAIRMASNAALHDRIPAAVALCAAGGSRERERALGTAILLWLFGPTTAVQVTHDAEAALFAGSRNGEGIVVCLGTGSIAFGRNAGGVVARAGGYGPLGSDEASFHWLGCHGLSAVHRSADGIGPHTAITHIMRTALGIKHVMGIAEHLYVPARPALAEQAAATAVLQAAGDGDPVAMAIMSEAARDVALMARSVAERLGTPAPVVHLAGGVVAMAEANPDARVFVPMVRRELKLALPEAVINVVQQPSALGAARMAHALPPSREDGDVNALTPEVRSFAATEGVPLMLAASLLRAADHDVARAAQLSGKLRRLAPLVAESGATSIPPRG